MLKDEDRIFQNLYNDFGAELDSAKKRGDWLETKEIFNKGRSWIIEELKPLNCVVVVEQVFQQV